MCEEVAVTMAKDDVRDDLWLSSVLLDFAPWPEAVVRPHTGQQVIQTSGAKPRPLTTAKQDVPGDDQDIFARTHGKSLDTTEAEWSNGEQIAASGERDEP